MGGIQIWSFRSKTVGLPATVSFVSSSTALSAVLSPVHQLGISFGVATEGAAVISPNSSV